MSTTDTTTEPDYRTATNIGIPDDVLASLPADIQESTLRVATKKRDDIATAKAVGMTVRNESTDDEPNLWGIRFPQFLMGFAFDCPTGYLQAESEEDAWSKFWEEDSVPGFTGRDGGECYLELYKWANETFGDIRSAFDKDLWSGGSSFTVYVNGICGKGNEVHTALAASVRAIIAASRAEKGEA